jgi:hypothetical protein
MGDRDGGVEGEIVLIERVSLRRRLKFRFVSIVSGILVKRALSP